jgi:hypothetical protein
MIFYPTEKQAGNVSPFPDLQLVEGEACELECPHLHRLQSHVPDMYYDQVPRNASSHLKVTDIRVEMRHNQLDV